ncbi:MAG: chromosomal replication initiator protein DnaA [Planctomycetes bacterium]|jgi:chromosomal replication initiator protein|nr:chromosomal replication initiator protein DnaA [Planctomycetota bacterium]MCL4731699.1 chromosomal replication initiator protein DnaA [Planctomycetota bacterium]
MPDAHRDVMSQWPAIEELALTRSRGLPIHDYLRNSKAGYDPKRDVLKLQLQAESLDKATTESIRNCVSKACYQVLGFQPNLEVTTSTAPSPAQRVRVEVASREPISGTAAADAPFLTSSRLPAGLDFGHFVIGPSNQMAAAAAVAVADNPGKAYNPLFIHGGVGLGKTHLLNAIARKLLPAMPRIRLMSCEEFVNRFVASLKNGRIEEMRRELRDSDALLIDDIHFLAGKEQTQEEFFHTFNHLYQLGKQIVLTSDSLPRDIPNLEDRLISRFHWGLAVKVEPPCTETRMAIVRKKSEARGIAVPDDVVHFLAENIVTNVRELEGAVVQLAALSSMSGKPISLPLAHEALRHLVKSRPAPARIATDDIIDLVCEHYSVRRNDLLSQRRTKNLAFPRHVAMFLAKELTQLTLTEIGNFFGGRDHSTVLHAINKIKGLRLKDAELRSELERFELQLRRPVG